MDGILWIFGVVGVEVLLVIMPADHSKLLGGGGMMIISSTTGIDFNCLIMLCCRAIDIYDLKRICVTESNSGKVELYLTLV